MGFNQRVITVSELTAYIRGILENDAVLAGLWVKGEISNLKRAVSGHIYFTLKDSTCCIRAVMFKSRAIKLRFLPENGMSVRVRGYISVYDRDGNYQLYAEEMEPDGVGALYVAFEQLKEKLRGEGLFDPFGKKKIPAFPGCIGIVTSPTGSVVKDIIEIIGRRWPGVKLVLVPVTVQGDAAPGEIAEGIRSLNALGGIDVLIVGRGGGSLEELWAFNTEVVARAIHMSGIPVISAVGHETDYTVADMVADLRAPTPSAAAELVVPVKADMAHMLMNMQNRLKRAVGEQLKASRRRLEICCQSRALRRPVDLICGARTLYCESTARALVKAMQINISTENKRLSSLAGRLNALSPLATMARGYSVCKKADSGEIIKCSGEVEQGDIVNIDLYRGSIKCEVKDVIKCNE